MPGRSKVSESDASILAVGPDVLGRKCRGPISVSETDLYSASRAPYVNRRMTFVPENLMTHRVSRMENGMWTPIPAKVASGRWTNPNSQMSSLSRSLHCTIGSAPTRNQPRE